MRADLSQQGKIFVLDKSDGSITIARSIIGRTSCGAAAWVSGQ